MAKMMVRDSVSIEFHYLLLKEILQCVYSFQDNNHDEIPLGPSRLSAEEQLIVKENMASLRRFFCRDVQQIDIYKEALIAFPSVFSLLSDEVSRQLFVQIIAYRLLGEERVKLPTNTEEYWALREKCKKMEVENQHMSTIHLNRKLSCFNLTEFGFPIQLYLTPKAACTIFLLKHYEYASPQASIKVELGDTVIDAGAGWGDTALYFAQEAGPEGRVYTFEFLPESLALIEKNLNLNPALQDRIKIIERPLWSQSDETVYFSTGGLIDMVHSTRQTPDDLEFQTISIDDFVEQQQLQRLDFIKMDIEGAELDTLQGARESLVRFRPKLAISIYHSISDLFRIPLFLASLDLNYEFYIGHYTIQKFETVLFCRPALNS